jgi:hypothetical protein
MATQLGLLSLTEYILHLSMMELQQLIQDLSNGQIFITDYKFDINIKNCMFLFFRPVKTIFKINWMLQDQ